VVVTITDGKGRTFATLPGTKEAGLNRLVWNLRPDNTKDVLVPPGLYQATVKTGDLAMAKTLKVEIPAK
jgi:hypothetical protein